MALRKLANSWQYDFTIAGHPRQRKGGFRTKAEAAAAEKTRREELVSGAKQFLFATVYAEYMAATRMKDRTRDSWAFIWKRVEPVLGHLYVDEVKTPAMDTLKQALPNTLGAKAINNHLSLVRAVLRFAWKRGKLQHVPYVPMESVPKMHQPWYTEQQRDRLLEGMFREFPHWYLFFYLTCRLGLRRGEVYGISRRQIQEVPPRLVVDQQIQVGTKTRPAKVITRKNDEAYELALTRDVIDAIRWHIGQGYAGETFLFSKDGTFPVYLDSYKNSLLTVQRSQGLPLLAHHAIGRHSVASQAATGGESIKAIQAQLGHRSEQSTHRYAHLGSRAQLRVVESLRPASPPHVNVASTDKKAGS